jgi:hypothetical protein
MIEIKNSFLAGLDLDTSPYELRRNAYIDALNITRDAVEGGQDMVITNIVGNKIVSHTFPSASSSDKVVGAYANTLRGTIIFMRYSVAGYDGVYEYNVSSGTITKIFESLTDSATNILNFNSVDKITSICIYNREEGDLLYFLDCLGRPTYMDITAFKAGTYTPVTRQIIDAGKMPPLTPPSFIYNNDTTKRSNGLLNKFLRFKYRWVYGTNEKSSWSPISQVIIPNKILDNTFTNVITNNNLITISLTSGAKDVKAIEVAMSYAYKANEWSDFALVDSINKVQNSIANDISFAYSFYNDSSYPQIDIQDSEQLFYYIPDKANCMVLANGNTLVMAGITEGYDRTLSPNVVITINTLAAGSGTVVGNLSVVVTKTQPVPTGLEYFLKFSGIPAAGTVVTVKLRKVAGGALVVVGTYTTVAGDTELQVRLGLQISMNSINIVQSVDLNGDGTIDFRFPIATYTYETTEITQPTATGVTSSIATWKWSTSRRIGIAYYDQKGKTNGILYDAKIVFPAYAENGSHLVLIPYINVKIYHTPPDWAYSYQFLVTKEPTSFIFWLTPTVNTSESDYIYFETTNFSINAKKNPTEGKVLSYTFQDGDRLRLIRRMSDQTVFNDTYDVAIDGQITDPSINGVVQTGKQFIKVKKVAPLSTVDYNSNNFVIELYRPGQTAASKTNETFYEFGQQFQIIDPTTSIRRHSGNVTDQDQITVTPAESNLYNGDSYFRSRQIYTSETGSGTFNIQDRNIVDFYISAVSSVDGRPSAIDINAKRQYYGALLRFGQAYQANTNVNGLNAFYSDNFQDVDYSQGSIRRMTIRDRFIRIFQDFKCGAIPIYSQINKSPSGDISVQTDQLLNPVQYYIGNFGIGTASESLTSYNNADYFCDNNRGIICRLSNDGVTPISVLYKVNSWANDHIPLRVGQYKIYGCYDPKSNNYIAALEATSTDAAYTLSFDEESNAFESFLSYHPEMMVTIGTLLISFKNGNLYTHNNSLYNVFYGTTYESSVTSVFNEKILEKKTWISVNEISNTIWDCPLIYSNANSYGTQRQQTYLNEGNFRNTESNYIASFMRDVNSRGGWINGSTMKGNILVIKFRKQSATSLVNLNIVSVKFIDSPITVS